MSLGLIGLWLLLDLAIDPANHVAEIVPASAFNAVLAAGATVPIGFVVSVFAAQLVWNPPRLHLWVKPLPDSEIAKACREKLNHLVAGADLPESFIPRALASVVINLALQRLKSDPAGSAVAQRIESLLDLNNGLANGATASFVTALAIPAAAWSIDAVSGDRLIAVVLSSLTAVAFGVLCTVGQHRVVGLTDSMLRIVFSGSPIAFDSTHG